MGSQEKLLCTGTFSAGTAERAQDLRRGPPLGSCAFDVPDIDKEIHLLVRRLAERGLLDRSFHL
jgi:hypothetical protein